MVFKGKLIKYSFKKKKKKKENVVGENVGKIL